MTLLHAVASLQEVGLDDTKQLPARAVMGQADATSRYVWEVEGTLLTSGEAEITIGDMQIGVNLAFVHERRYALRYLLGFRNPQADIDHYILRESVRPGDVVLDAGANIGVTAAEALASGASHVVCAEPENALFGRLHALSERYPGRMTVQHCALGASEGFADLLLSVVHNQGHTISSVVQAQFATIFGDQWQKVRVATIDDVLANKHADIWKLDVEGAEADVVRGARRTLEHSPPRIIIAELYDAFVDEVVGLLPSYRVRRAALDKKDYRLCFLDEIGGALPDEFCATSPVYAFSQSD
jgi:FkbM family methyltransferase